MQDGVCMKCNNTDYKVVAENKMAEGNHVNTSVIPGCYKKQAGVVKILLNGLTTKLLLRSAESAYKGFIYEK